ncbi:MAG TPA: 16S rRNA (guanine(966)-N(2))-methyltransferase RsmD [Candidatus Sumerlaeota bacterium]|nr:16S rRNA (guanine(966)-N(2))-methyltransferase RsmD [Candidatus Sumerlaeota bacterium]HPS00923.1 16S rRNA (guanine(966)-N(2))-methyltransferase RsmD [Candidatus Sumerlaeota bacterium]
MLRITGGEWRGRKLKTPAGLATRPTPSMVREALFNILGPLIEEYVFFDLFAGSGIVGFEALSRGASRAVFVEQSREALACLRENFQLLGCGTRAVCVPQAMPGALNADAFRCEEPALFFLDPPYKQGWGIQTLEALGGLPAVRQPGHVCVVQAEKEALLEDHVAEVWGLRRRYTYGATALWVYDTRIA